MVGNQILERRLWAVVVALLALLLTACGSQIPTDPHGTLNRMRDGVMRVGATENSPWVKRNETTEPTGTEPGLLSDFAEQIGSEIEWSTGSEAVLLDGLERGELDIVIGGFLEDTPWVDKGAATRPYLETTTVEGQDKHVMIVRMGENALLVALEKFLVTQVGS